MAIKCIGLALDLLGRIGEPLGGRRVNDPLGNAAVALGGAEFAREIFVAAHAFARHPRIEEERPEAHLDRNVRSAGDRPLQTALADEAPGTDDVGYHFDG